MEPENNLEAQQPESTTTSLENTTTLSVISTGVTKIKAELSKVIVGQKDLIDSLIIAIIANGHCLIEGVPGIAKTLSAKLLAQSIQVNFSRIQFTPDLMPSDILGTSVFNQKTANFDFKAGPIFTNLVLIDEINRAPAKTQSALFEVMAERQITIDGSTYPMANPFIVLATQNPIEQEGTYRLPEAQLDRFLFKIEIDYPDLADEVTILQQHNVRRTSQMEVVNGVLNAKDILEMQRVAKEVTIEDSVVEYIAKIVNQTRNNPLLFLGASPRASISILDAAKARAAMLGRDFVIPEDVKFVALPALRHRVIVSPEKEMEGLTPDFVVKEMIESIEVPR
jgi:MoxR-like ATPase|tara:strand:+ start:8683 stop:9696 length:1014 start_codon:yes stop_codon:yes gene_type:complete